MTALEEAALAEMERVAEVLEELSEPDPRPDEPDCAAMVAAREAAEELRLFVTRARLGIAP